MKFIVFVLSFLFLTIPSFAKEKFTMAVLGNSVVRAALADTQLGDPTTLSKLSVLGSSIGVGAHAILLYLAGQGENTHDPRKKARFRDRAATPYARHWLSFAIGKQDYSLPIRVQYFLGEKIRLKNYGMMAGEYQNSFVQLERMERDFRGKKRPDLIVTSFMGMDFLAGHHVGFKENVQRFFRRLVAFAPNAKILIMGVGNIVSNTIADDRVIAEVGGKKIMCSQVYDLAVPRLRQIYEIYPGASGPEVDEAHAINKWMNDSVSAEFLKIKLGLGDYSGFMGKVAFVDIYELTSGDWLDNIAMDCIHPSQNGHRIMSELAWQTILDRLDL